ncbi:cytochrome P450, partial [Massarina eburnea CBS 473.64]
LLYNLFLHPLSKYPGPRLAACSKYWYIWKWTGGRWPFVTRELHDKYGDIVRIAPNELSFSNVESWNEIYGHANKGRKIFLKSDFYERGASYPSIVTARNPEEHRRQRKALSHAFSASALRDQEQIIHQYTDMFIGRLEEWKLAFGESFDAVKMGRSHPWVSTVMDTIREQDLMQHARDAPWLALIFPFFVPSGLMEKFKLNRQYTLDKVTTRIKNQDKITRVDFFKHILEKGDLPRPGLDSNADLLIIAGSETTATCLSGITYWLHRNPDCLSKLKSEVRNNIASFDDITGDVAAKLPYLNAVIEEGLRIYPPVPFGLKRISQGAVVSEQYIPAGTTVSTPSWVAHHDKRYWKDPDSFRPERWIDEGFGDNHGAFNPFSLGPRVCLGINLAYLEMRVILTKLIFSYDWEVVQDLDWDKENVAYVLWKKPELRMRFHRRTTV